MNTKNRLIIGALLICWNLSALVVHAGIPADRIPPISAVLVTNLEGWEGVADSIVLAEEVIQRPAGLALPSAEELVQQQLDAYNARDIDAFLKPYADDVELYNFPNQPISVGKERMRVSYGKLFKTSPDLHCELVDRMVMGNTVIDQERVTFRKGEPPLNAMAIYKIKDGKIAQVYFITD